MKHRQSKVIIGSAISLATLAIAIDHTRHRLPVVVPQQAVPVTGSGAYMPSPDTDDSPCSFTENPCSMDSPCSMDDNPCSLD